MSAAGTNDGPAKGAVRAASAAVVQSTVPAVRRCGMTACASTDTVRPFPCGWRCRACTPSVLAGVPEPDALLAEHRRRLATTTPNTSAERTAG